MSILEKFRINGRAPLIAQFSHPFLNNVVQYLMPVPEFYKYTYLVHTFNQEKDMVVFAELI